MLSIIEDQLSEIIESKLSYLKNTPSVIPKILNINPTRLARISQYVQKMPLKVIRGFPRTPSDLPCICILLSNDDETQDGLGNIEMDEDTDDELLEVLYSSSYRAEVWSDNGDLTVELYHLLKWALLSGRKDLIKQGLFNQKLGGTDFEPAPEYFPIFVYRRALTFWCQTVESVLLVSSGDPVTGVVITDHYISEQVVIDTEEE